MTRDPREVTLSDLRAGDVVTVRTQGSIYRCVIKNDQGFATITGNKKYKGPYTAQIIGALGPLGLRTGILSPGERMYFHFSVNGSEDLLDVITSPVVSLVVNNETLVRANFGARKM